MESEEQLKYIMEKIKSPKNPVGIDPVYVHAIIINRLIRIENQIKELESKIK